MSIYFNKVNNNEFKISPSQLKKGSSTRKTYDVAQKSIFKMPVLEFEMKQDVSLLEQSKIPIFAKNFF